MTSLEKRHSRRRKDGHRKHSRGTSSGRSLLDETDREVSNLTDRAFRSLCIGEEAVYNDSDPCTSSPYTQTARQQAFEQSAAEDRDREELKRAAQEGFSLQMQQYDKQDWIQGGLYGAATQADQQWRDYGEWSREEGDCATFQHSLVDMSMQQTSLSQEQLSFLSNGFVEMGSQQSRSRSRVSSLIKAFNNEGYRDGGGLDGKLQEWNSDTSWDKSALMSIERELCEFSTAYHQDFNSHAFPSTGQCASQERFYSSEVATSMTHVDAASSFMRSSYSKHSMSTNSNCNLFIHSELSPFRAWRDHNSFPFRHRNVCGYVPPAEFPKCYETPLYKELSLSTQPHPQSMLEQRGVRHHRRTLEPVAPHPPQRSTSTATVLQKASALQKRCESEFAGNNPPWKRAQSVGTNRLPSQRPTTVSPAVEMSRCVRDTLSSISGLQQTFTRMTSEQSVTNVMSADQPGVLHYNDSLTPFTINNTAVTREQNIFNSNTSTAPLTPAIHTQGEVAIAGVQQYAVSPLTVEHAPVRAESRGATPGMSNYKSRATSLLFNLKDNRKRVKSTYSPNTFKGVVTTDKKQNRSMPRDIVIDIPDFSYADMQPPQMLMQEDGSIVHNMSHQTVQGPYGSGPQLTTTHTNQYIEHEPGGYQSEMVYQSGFSAYTQEKYTNNQLANGQFLQEDLSFKPYNQDESDKAGTLADDYRQASSNRLGVSNTMPMAHLKDNLSAKSPYSRLNSARLNVDYNRQTEYQITYARAEENTITPKAIELAKSDTYEHMKDYTQGYTGVSSQHDRKQDYQDSSTAGLNNGLSWPLNNVIASSEQQQSAQALQIASMKEAYHPEEKKQGEQGHWNRNAEQENTSLWENLAKGNASLPQKTVFNTPYQAVVSPNLPHQYMSPTITVTLKDATSGTVQGKHDLQNHYGSNEIHDIKENNLPWKDHAGEEYEKILPLQEVDQKKQNASLLIGNQVRQDLQKGITPQHNNRIQGVSLSSALTNKMAERQTGTVTVEQITSGQSQEGMLVAQLKHTTQARPQGKTNRKEAFQTQQGTAVKNDSPQVKDVQSRAARGRVQETGKIQAEQAKTAENKEQTSARKATVEQTTAEQYNTEMDRSKQTIQGLEEKAIERKAKEERVNEQVRAQLAKAEKAERDRTEQANAEQSRRGLFTTDIKTERITAQLNETDWKRTEPVDTGQTQEQGGTVNGDQIKQPQVGQGETQQKKTQQNREEKVKTEPEALVRDRIKADHTTVKESVQGDVSQHEPQAAKTELPKSLPDKADMVKTEQGNERAKTEWSKEMWCKSDAYKIEKIKAASKWNENQANTGKVKQPDRVEQVKTELAKAKAELAQIKEKMRETQEDKVKKTVSKEVKEESKANDKYQDNNNSIVNKYGVQVDRGYDDYERVREKYGYITAPSASKCPETSIVSSMDDRQKSAAAVTDVATTSNIHLKNGDNSTVTTMNSNYDEVKGNQYVYSESSKEFKLTSDAFLPVNEKESSKSVNAKTKNDGMNHNNSEKCETLKPHANVSLLRDVDSAKALFPEGKLTLTDHSVVSGKDSHSTAFRTLSHKERAQTKQEILTSKIKAHAEKEISAIKEKSFAKRDMHKNPTKHLLSGNSTRQKPPTQGVSKGHETMKSTITPTPLPDHSGMNIEPARSSNPRSAMASKKSSQTTVEQQDSNSKKQVPQYAMKSNDIVLQKPTQTNQPKSNTKIINEELKHTLKKEEQSENKSQTQSKQQAENQEMIIGGNSGKLKEEPKSKATTHTDLLKRDDALKIKEAVKTLSKPQSPPSEMMESKCEAVLDDSAPSLKLVIGQIDGNATDDDLQIMGIMVTVRERMPSLSKNLPNIDVKQETREAQEKEGTNSEPANVKNNPHLEQSRGNYSSKDADLAKHKDSAELQTQPLNETIEVENNHPTEHEMQEASNHKTKMSNDNTLDSEKNMISKEITSTLCDAFKSTLLHDPKADEVEHQTVVKPPKNKVLAETQPFLLKHGVITKHATDYTNNNLNENSTRAKEDELQVKVEEKKLNKEHKQHKETNVIQIVESVPSQRYSSRSDNSTKQNHLPSAEDNVSEQDANSSKSVNTDGESAPLPVLVGRRTDTEKLSENSLTEASVHIDSITIQIIPEVTEKDCLGKTDTDQNINIPLNSVSGVSEIKHVKLPSPDAKIKTNTEEVQIKLLTPLNKMLKTTKDTLLEDQHMSPIPRQDDISMGPNDQHCNVATTCEERQADRRKTPVAVDQIITSTAEEYFHVQRVAKPNHGQYDTEFDTEHSLCQRLNEGQAEGSLRKAQKEEIATLESNINPLSVECEVNVLDQTKMTTSNSSPTTSTMDTKRINTETNDDQVSKQSDTSTVRQTKRSADMQAGQDIPITKHAKNKQSQVRWRGKDSLTSRENAPDPKLEVKTKPKERVSTIPEISAIADYARLKVIVADDRQDTITTDLPPGKKGLFPIIQTRHSRRPVFTTEKQKPPVCKKPLTKEQELSNNVKKEHKSLVFSKMEQDHKRTGMFKLGDKEKQDGGLQDDKSNDGLANAETMSTTHLKESRRPAPAPRTNKDTQRLSHDEKQRIVPSHSPFTPEANSASSGNSKARNASLLEHVDEGINYIQVIGPTNVLLDDTSNLQTNTREPSNMQDSRPGQRQDQRIIADPDNGIPAKSDKGCQENKAHQQEWKDDDTQAARTEQMEENTPANKEEERKARDRVVAIAAKAEEENAEKHRREMERIAAHMEEERRAAMLAEERRLKQVNEERRRELERRAEEERRDKMIAAQNEERRTKEMEERRTKRREEERAMQEEEERAKEIKEKRRAKEIEEKRRAKEIEERRAKEIEEKKRTKEIEERRAKVFEEKRRAKEIEERRAKGIKEKMREKEIEEIRRTKEIEERRRAKKIEEKKQAEEERKIALAEAEMKAKQRQEERRLEQERRAAQVKEETIRRQRKEERRAAQVKEETVSRQREEERRAAKVKEETVSRQREEERRAAKVKEETVSRQREEERRAAQKEKQRRAAAEELKRAKGKEELRTKVMASRRASHTENEGKVSRQEEQERMAAVRDEDRRAKQREEAQVAQREEQRRAALRMDALQYYAITPTSERRSRETLLPSPSPPERTVEPSPIQPAEESGFNSRPSAPPSPAPPTLSRSNTSSPALGPKPTMFRVKDNTSRNLSFTKSVKPCLHKGFGEDFRVGSPLDEWRGSDRGDDDLDRTRRGAGTPVHLPGPLGSQPTPYRQDHPAVPVEHRAYTRRSLVLDEEDSRSLTSNVSEDVESFATSASDMSDVRGMYDYERPESACSFNSDLARSLGKPPTVPPKSDQALRRAQRLNTRRIKKELRKSVAESPTPPETLSDVPCFVSEQPSSSHYALASPHFSAPVSLPHAPAVGCAAPSLTEPPPPQRSVHASPHTTAPVSLRVAPKNIPSSPTLQRANHPVKQYHVEPNYSQAFPLTQRKVLQDPGSGQYFVVDMPVEVKTKTFIDPQTGRYVHLNVRQSSQSSPLSRSLPSYPQPRLPPQLLGQPQQQPSAGKPCVLSYPQRYQPMPISSLPPHRSSSATSTPSGPPLRVPESQNYGYQDIDRAGSCHGHNYSPEQSPYMHTASDTDKGQTINTAPESNSHLEDGSVYENHSSAHSSLAALDIINMSELEDFMDW